MTTKRNCFVTDVCNAIEKLADALDPQRNPPFRGDILDLLELATKNVLAMRAEIERLKTVPMKYRRMAFNAQLQDENAKLSQQLADSQKREAMLRDAFYCVWWRDVSVDGGRFQVPSVTSR